MPSPRSRGRSRPARRRISRRARGPSALRPDDDRPCPEFVEMCGGEKLQAFVDDAEPKAREVERGVLAEGPLADHEDTRCTGPAEGGRSLAGIEGLDDAGDIARQGRQERRLPAQRVFGVTAGKAVDVLAAVE